MPTDAGVELVDEVSGAHPGAVVSVIDGLDEAQVIAATEVIRRIAGSLDDLARRS